MTLTGALVMIVSWGLVLGLVSYSFCRFFFARENKVSAENLDTDDDSDR